MGQNKKTNALVILILLGVIIAFAYSYNASVTTAVADAAYNDREILHSYNTEIIQKLIKEPATATWTNIVEQYEDIVIVIENSSNKVITRSIGRTWSALDVKVQTPFEYHGDAYVIKSSVYLLRDYVADIRVLVKFIFVEFVIGISALFLLIFIIYTIMLRPYRIVYKAIEEYDRTGKLQKNEMKGYAGKVYKRFYSLTQNLETQQKNQRRIIASISHDIKTPLTSIMGYAERLKKDNIPPERKERYIDTVYGKSVEIQRLIDEFDEYLSFNMLQQVKTEEVTCEQLAQFVSEEYGDELEANNISFTVNNMADEAVVLLDMQKIKRVLGNIIGNSIKHMTKAEKIICMDITAEKETVLISVYDNGEGVDPEKYDVIFEPLYTSDQGRKVAGLGLAICKEIIDSHDGTIYASSSDLGGLKICIELQRNDKNTFMKLIHKTVRE